MTERRSSRAVPTMLPPVRRVLALDAGSRRLKMLLAETDFGRLRILKEELIDLQAEGLVSPEELKTHLQGCLESWGKPPLALVVPEHLSISQVIDLPEAPAGEVEKQIASETLKLSGVAESRVVYDFVQLDSGNSGRQRFWVTLCQEENIRERIRRLGIEQEDLAEVTTTANALITAYRQMLPLSSRAILVHFGVQSTVLVILLGGQGAFATTFQMGGDFFTRALSRLRKCSDRQAEDLKKNANLFSGPEALPEFVEVVDGWVAELKRQLNEWFQQYPALAQEVKSFALIVSGGGFGQPGLLEHLRTHASLDLHPWPQPVDAATVAPSPGFEAAYGVAVQSLGHSDAGVSLLPDDYRAAWRKRLGQQRVDLVSFGLLCLCVVLLAIGTWRKLSLYTAKKALWDKVQAGQLAVEANDALSGDLLSEYEKLRPVVAGVQNTADTLKTLSLLQKTTKTNFWYVLVADQQSYFSRPPAVLSTNRPARTNLLGPSLEALRLVPIVPRVASLSVTNAALARPGLIAELCVPGEAEASRQLLSELVSGLKQQPMFSKVDLLSEDLRRTLADPKLLVPDRYYALALDFAETDFQQPVPAKKAPPGTRNRRHSKPSSAETSDLGGTAP